MNKMLKLVKGSSKVDTTSSHVPSAPPMEYVPFSYCILGKLSFTGPVKVTYRELEIVSALVISEALFRKSNNPLVMSLLIRDFSDFLKSQGIQSKFADLSLSYWGCDVACRFFVNKAIMPGDFQPFSSTIKRTYSCLTKSEELVKVSVDLIVNLSYNTPDLMTKLQLSGYKLSRVKDLKPMASLTEWLEYGKSTQTFDPIAVCSALGASLMVKHGSRAAITYK